MIARLTAFLRRLFTRGEPALSEAGPRDAAAIAALHAASFHRGWRDGDLVGVSMNRRGKGLARRLLDLHLRGLAGLGARAIFLEVDQDNVPALRLYKRAGFREVGRRDAYYRNADGKTTAALVLRRDLV